jgi:hypothetical protein
VSGRGRASARLVIVVAGTLVVVLAGLGVSVAVVAGVADGVGAAASRLRSAPAAAPARSRTVTETMKILTDKSFGPTYTNSDWSVRAGDTVVLRITSYDDGTAPLTGSQEMFDRVEGTVGGTETVAGAPVRTVANGDVAHTFTVVGLGLNLPIPAAPTGGAVTVVARFVARRTGSYVWQCYAPCGSGPNLMGGPMAAMTWMEGKVEVEA